MLGRYLGPEIDVGLEIMDKILEANGKVVHCLKYRGIKEYDKSNLAHISLRKEFDNIIRYRYETEILPDEFPDLNLEDTPLYYMYEYDTTDAEVGLAGNTEDNGTPTIATELYQEIPTPVSNNYYVNASVMLLRGNTYDRVKIIEK